MADKHISTTREALMAELLIDVDRLINKISDLDKSLSETIEKSTKDAASKGFLAASFQIKKLTEDFEIKIDQACIKSQISLNESKTQYSAQHYSLPQKLIANLFLLCVTGGVLGTVIGQLLYAYL